MAAVRTQRGEKRPDTQPANEKSSFLHRLVKPVERTIKIAEGAENSCQFNRGRGTRVLLELVDDFSRLISAAESRVEISKTGEHERIVSRKPGRCRDFLQSFVQPGHFQKNKSQIPVAQVKIRVLVKHGGEQ